MPIAWDSCCPYLLDDISEVLEGITDTSSEAQAAAAEVFPAVHPYIELINSYPGVWIDAPPPLPSLSELVQRISTLGTGFATWSKYITEAEAAEGISTLYMPAEVVNYRVSLNGVAMCELDYQISSYELQFTHELEAGDLVTVKSYGSIGT